MKRNEMFADDCPYTMLCSITLLITAQSLARSLSVKFKPLQGFFVGVAFFFIFFSSGVARIIQRGVGGEGSEYSTAHPVIFWPKHPVFRKFLLQNQRFSTRCPV